MEKKYEEMFDQVFDLIEAGRTAEAMSVAQDLVDHNMGDDLAWGAYGEAKLAWGDVPLAIKGFEQCVSINPNSYQGYASLARCYSQLENDETAVKYYEKALQLENSKIDVWSEYLVTLENTAGVDVAIEKCLYAIDVVEEKTELENILGCLYVDKACDNVYDIPDDPENPNGDSTPGFILLEDIHESRDLCKKAKTLITLEDYKDQAERAETVLKLCDEDEFTKVRVSKMSFLIIHALLSVVVCFFLMYTIVLIPFFFIAPWATFPANRFPIYVLNFAAYHGTFDPLVYYKKGAATRGAEGFADTFFNPDNAGIVKAYIWVVRTRIVYYKSIIQKIKDKNEAKKYNNN